MYFSSIGNIQDPRSDCHDISQPIPQIFKTVVVLSVIPYQSLDTPPGPLLLYTLKKITKIPHDIDILCCQPKIFH
jgi:hypothetical protein